MKVDLKREWVSHWPFSPAMNRSSFTPDRLIIKTADGLIVNELLQPPHFFDGYEMDTPWSYAQVAYFAGYTMWTYLTSPFILKQPDVVYEEIEPWEDDGELWRRLRVVFPDSIATHSTEQTFYFNKAGIIVHHDYEVDIQGRNAAARYLLEPVTVQDITLPSKMRIYARNPDNTVRAVPLIVTIDLSDFSFEA